ncbi:MAG: TonB-dependent receptor [Runella sp.]
MVFSFVGYKTQEIAAAANLNVKMAEASGTLDEVFITATTQPIRKIETVTAVESIGLKEMARMNPINLADAIRYTPGVYVQTQSGRVRNYIFMRGFPDVVGNGLGYTSVLYDGLRTFASPEMVPDAAFRYDTNIERIEVVRGSAAILYGRGAVAGAVNVISKTGGEQLAGLVRTTFSNNSMRQVDFNLNGSLNPSKSLRFNVGGFLLRDMGFRNNPFPDEGGQMRGNIDYLLPNNKGSVRVYGGYTNMNIQNQLDIPYLANDLSKPAPGWSSRDVLLPRSVFENRIGSLTYPDGTVETVDFTDVTRRGNFSKGGNIGLQFNFDLGQGWSITNRARWQQITVGIGFDFALSTTYGPNAAGVISQQRALFGGGITGGGSNATDFINELRINKQLTLGNSKHNFTFGYYYSTLNTKVASRGLIYLANTTPNSNVVTATPLVNSLFRNGDYVEAVNSAFVGDEMKIGNKLSITAGLRQDWINLDLVEDRHAFQRFARRTVQHQGLGGSVGFNYLFNDNTALYGNYVRAYRAPDYGAYTTVQYAFRTPTNPTPTLFNPSTAPANAILTDEKGRTLYLNPYIDNNEIVNSVEMGFRKSFGDFNFDGGVFYNTIRDRLVSTFVGAIAVSVPGGNNRIFGSEVSLGWYPTNLKGFFARTSFTAQDAIYTKLVQQFTLLGDLNAPFTSRQEVSRNAAGVPTYIYSVDVAGKKAANVPRIIWNTSVGYENSRFGINLNNNFLGARPADPFNTIDYPAYSLVDANIFYNIALAKESKGNMRFKLSGYNLLNNQSPGNVISAVTDNYLYIAKANNFQSPTPQGNFTFVRGVPLLPRRLFASIEFNF